MTKKVVTSDNLSLTKHRHGQVLGEQCYLLGLLDARGPPADLPGGLVEPASPCTRSEGTFGAP